MKNYLIPLTFILSHHLSSHLVILTFHLILVLVEPPILLISVCALYALRLKEDVSDDTNYFSFREDWDYIYDLYIIHSSFLCLLPDIIKSIICRNLNMSTHKPNDTYRKKERNTDNEKELLKLYTCEENGYEEITLV